MEFLKEMLILFRRFVDAHEKLAEANSVLAQGFAAGVIQQASGPLAAVAPVIGPESAPEEPQTVAAPETGEPDVKVDWNPLTASIQGRYGKDKITVLDAELAARGITVKANATGAEKHQAVLDHEKRKAVAPAEQPDVALPQQAPEPQIDDPFAQTSPLPRATPAPEPAKSYTVDEVRQALKRLTITYGAQEGVSKAYALLAAHGGGAKQISEVKPELYPAVMAAVQRELGEAA